VTRKAAALAIAAAFVAGLAAGLSVRAAEAPRPAVVTPPALMGDERPPAADRGAPQNAGTDGPGESATPVQDRTPGAGTPTPQATTGKRPASPEAQPTAKPSAAHPRTVTGIASTYGPGWDGWIAWPGGPGWRLRVCGAGGCRTVRSNDAGPSKAMQRIGRVIDLDVPTFTAVCGVPWTRGLCRVRVTVLGR
jgi:hypothetical protein